MWEGILRLSKGLPRTPLRPTFSSGCISHSSHFRPGLQVITPPPLCTPSSLFLECPPGLASQVNPYSSFKSRRRHPLL